MALDEGYTGPPLRTIKTKLKQYQLQWRPNFPDTRYGPEGGRIYVLGEKKKYVGQNLETAFLLPEENGPDLDTFDINSIIDVATNSVLILPFNNSVALAQEYVPQVSNKIVEYETLGGDSILNFGQRIKKIGLKIKIIKAGRFWETYEKGLQAMAYLSANQGRYYGSLYLLGYDMFADGTQNFVGRYQVSVNSLNFTQRSSETTTLSANLEMTVERDFGYFSIYGRRPWGR